MGFLLLALGLAIGAAVFVGGPGLHVPRWLGYIAASLFVLAAARVFEMSPGRAGVGDWFAALFFGGSAIISGWIALAPGARGCTQIMGTSSRVVGGLGCRVPFGISMVICAAIGGYLSWRIYKGKFSRGR
jgi:hypothetical protein